MYEYVSNTVRVLLRCKINLWSVRDWNGGAQADGREVHVLIRAQKNEAEASRAEAHDNAFLLL